MVGSLRVFFLGQVWWKKVGLVQFVNQVYFLLGQAWYWEEILVEVIVEIDSLNYLNLVELIPKSIPSQRMSGGLAWWLWRFGEIFQDEYSGIYRIRRDLNCS